MQHASRMHRSLIQSAFFAPRGRARIFELGMQISQLYLSPFDKLIGVIGDAGSGKSALIKGMFPGLELTNDDDGVNVRPLPILDVDTHNIFYNPHTYHLDIRFETGFTQPHVLADAITEAIRKGKRVVVEHFELIYPLLDRNADLLIGVGEQILVSRPTMFGPEPQDFANVVHASLRYRLMAHTAEDLCEVHMGPELESICKHDDIHNGFMLAFDNIPEGLNIPEIEKRVLEDIAKNLPVAYKDESHISFGDLIHGCSGPRTHVNGTGKIEGFRLYPELVHDKQNERWLMIGFVGENSQAAMDKLRQTIEASERNAFNDMFAF